MSAALLVDDDQQLLASVEASARTAGLDLVTADSWNEGLSLFHVLSPDLVIADYNMPGSRFGLQLLAEIRRLRPSVRLVLVSGYLDEGDMKGVADLNLVTSTLTKGNSIDTAEAILNEVRQASESAALPTDWPTFAHAFISATQVSDETLSQLEAILRAKIGEQESAVASDPPGPGAASPTLAYLDTSALMRWTESDITSPEARDVRGGAVVDALIDGGGSLAVSELTLVEFRSAVAVDWRRNDPQKAECDAAWAARAKTALMARIADRRITVVPVPIHAFEHAMTLVDMAARDHGMKLGMWDAIHLITACAWAQGAGARVRLYTSDPDFEEFVVAYPHFAWFAEISRVDTE